MHKGIMAIEALRLTLIDNLYVNVIHERGYTWNAYCYFNQPSTKDVLSKIEEYFQNRLPVAYTQFLERYDGAKIYDDNEYGQWGFQLYGTQEIISKNDSWKKRYVGTWPDSYIAFAESFGDADLLVLDTAKPTRDGTDCRVIDGDSGYPPHKWESAARSFGEWLDQLVVAQGAKYWRWLR